MIVSQELQRGVRLHQQGQLAEAGAIYHRVLQQDPRIADAWHLVGLLAHQVGDHAAAGENIARAIQLDNRQPVFFSNLAATLVAADQLDEAERICQLCQSKFPQHAEGWNVHGNIHRQRDEHTAALVCYRRAAACDGNSATILSNLGGVLTLVGEAAEAEPCLLRAHQLDPSIVEPLSNLAVLRRQQGRIDDARDWLAKALAIAPHRAELHMNLGNCFRQQGQLSAAVQAYEQAVKLQPDLAPVYNGIGLVLQDLGRAEEALEYFQQARHLAPRHQNHASNYLFCLNLCADMDRETLYQAHQQWGASLPRPAQLPSHNHMPDPDRPLRIGYMSPDFRGHAVARFLEPILASHCASGQQVYCYAEVAAPDATTEKLSKYAREWRITCGKTDIEVSRMIRHDEVDILVDLAGHTANNRLPVLVHRPAPVQVSMLGYPYTTGLREVDYYVTNPWRDPESEDAFYTERLIRLKHGPTTFQAPDHAPEVAPAPLLHCGHITLGSTHRLDKLTSATLSLWGRVLRALPNSRLLVFRTSLGADPDVRASLLERMEQHSLDVARVDLRWQTTGSYLEIYSQMDLLLEVCPWGSGTTAYESMWMGVPLVGLFGERPASRPACALLQRMGLSDLVARDAGHYVERIRELALAPQRLIALRSRLRGLMQQTVADAVAFTSELEGAYRMMWRHWCSQQQHASS